MEEAAALLGIPMDAYGHPISRKPNSSLDLRNPDFKKLLAKISNAILFLCEHTEIQDCMRYGRWLVTLQNRASSIVSREMRELLDGAFKTCEDALAKQQAASRVGPNGQSEVTTKWRKIQPTFNASLLTQSDGPQAVQTPLESHVSYNKFRGLGKRMRDLLELLEYSVIHSEAGGAEYALFALPPAAQRAGAASAYWGGFGGRGGDGSDGAPVSSDVAMKDLFEMYFVLR